MNKRLWFSVFLLLSIAALSYWLVTRPSQESLSPAAFNAKSAGDQDVVVLDVRTPEEVSRGYIPGAIFIDYKDPQFENNIKTLDPDKTYLIYCKAGGRSSKTRDMMKQMGFENVYELEGGYDRWKAEGYNSDGR